MGQFSPLFWPSPLTQNSENASHGKVILCLGQVHNVVRQIVLAIDGQNNNSPATCSSCNVTLILFPLRGGIYVLSPSNWAGFCFKSMMEGTQGELQLIKWTRFCLSCWILSLLQPSEAMLTIQLPQGHQTEETQTIPQGLHGQAMGTHGQREREAETERATQPSAIPSCWSHLNTTA